MGEEPEKKYISEDAKKMNSFYSFKMDDKKLETIRQRSKKQVGRFAVTGIIFGFFTEWLLGNSSIYDNIVKKSTLRRLKAKKKEQMMLQEKQEQKGKSKVALI